LVLWTHCLVEAPSDATLDTSFHVSTHYCFNRDRPWMVWSTL